MNLLLMADQRIGLEIARWLFERYRADVALVVTISENDIFLAARDSKIACVTFKSADQVCSQIRSMGLELDIGLLAWWPNLVKAPLLGVPKHGFINTHPSLLPHDRGKHPNFWALVDQVPYGVSLHFVGQCIDSGDIVAQTAVPYGWQDNGATVYARACEETVRLFQATYPAIRKLEIPRKVQDIGIGSFHLAAELEQASIIDLDRHYRARDLLNLLRARTFPGHPACWFRDGGEAYEVRIEINKKSQ